MNTIKLILIIGLVYIALTQKKEKTRNMLLLITGLLAFCMFSLEGFTINKNNFNTIFGSVTEAAAPNKDVKIEGNNMIVTGSDGNVYKFSKDKDIDMTEKNNITCKINYSNDGEVTLKEGASEVTTATDISSLFECNSLDAGKTKCSEAQKSIKNCPDYYSINGDKYCDNEDCIKDDFSKKGNCCSELCDEKDCEFNLFGKDDGGDCEKSYIPFLYRYKCKKEDNDE